MSAVENRRKKIISMLKKNKTMNVENIIKAFDFSPATIRSDLKYLNNKGDILREHGKASIKPPKSHHKFNFDNIFSEKFIDREQLNHKQKIAISKKAFSFIHDSQCIMLDASSTCYELAKRINKSSLQLTIVTNGFMIAKLLKNNPLITVILIGGVLNGISNAMEGLLGKDLLNKLYIDCAFLSPNAFSIKNGLTDFSLYEVDLKREMAKTSQKCIGLISSEKIDRDSVAQFAKTEQINKFIISTGEFYHKNFIKQLNEYDIPYILV